MLFWNWSEHHRLIYTMLKTIFTKTQSKLQKHSPEGVLYKSWFEKFHRIHQKVPVLEPVFYLKKPEAWLLRLLLFVHGHSAIALLNLYELLGQPLYISDPTLIIFEVNRIILKYQNNPSGIWIKRKFNKFLKVLINLLNS